MENFYGCIFCKLYCLGATTLQLTSTDSDIDSQSSVGDETNKNRTRGFVSDCMSSSPTSTKYRHRMRRKMQYKSKNNNKKNFVYLPLLQSVFAKNLEKQLVVYTNRQ